MTPFETMVVLQSVIQVKTVSFLETNSSAPTYDSFETMVVLQTARQVQTISLLDSSETNSSAPLMTPFEQQ
jgi:hypothetical protein